MNLEIFSCTLRCEILLKSTGLDIRKTNHGACLGFFMCNAAKLNGPFLSNLDQTYMCVSGFSSEKTKYGRSALSFILQILLYRYCIFHFTAPIFHQIWQYFPQNSQ